ncbi:cryptochrome/photolyase family protein [Flavobacterium rhizosphaerae]|uniref:Deoxyribodipyrimidine photo-lyase n=1 Tax=Flavobacterium rhizosphaerae TaxID=3163298 RepID=A0ABW8YVC7_9FLAO
MVIHWFRRDLRINDNTAFYNAVLSGEEVLPIFIFDPNILEELPEDDARVTFISNLLDDLQATFKKHQRALAVFYDTPENVFKKLLEEHDITAVYANRDYEPYARERDETIEKLLRKHNAELKTFKDQVIFETAEILKDNGEPYVVYTPYSKKWLEKFKNINLTQQHHEIKADTIFNHNYKYIALQDIGFRESDITPVPFDIDAPLLDNYKDTRNFPARDGTSRLGPYLRFGAVSIREIVKKTAGAKENTFLKELIWREFFMQILWHYPNTVTKAFKPKYDTINWRNDEENFKAWCSGKTGYPIVDAGMRQLNTTGYIHNRVRMVVASFLCKHLLIDWRKGEAYFAEKLLDYEQSSNIGNWQWAAGSGVDAAPYFRIFNPTEQVKKFDKDLAYIKKWVPEFEEIDYKPIVEHKEARERALKVYKDAVSES